MYPLCLPPLYILGGMSYASRHDDAPTGPPPDLSGLAPLFNETVRFVDPDQHPADGRAVPITVERLPAGRNEARHLSNDRLPFILLPEDCDAPRNANLVLVALEGADRQMADALGALLNPAAVTLALIHVTWLSGIVTSPLDEKGLDDPQPSDLLLYRGALEALVTTADELRNLGFDVRTFLRENRDPAVPIAEFSKEAGPALIALGLGRHGSGIGERLLRNVRLPVLFVRAR